MSSQCPVSDLSALLCPENLSVAKIHGSVPPPSSLLSQQNPSKDAKQEKGINYDFCTSRASQKLVTGGAADGFIAKSMGEFKTPGFVVVIGSTREFLVKTQQGGPRAAYQLACERVRLAHGNVYHLAKHL